MRPINFNAISKFYPTEFLLGTKERHDLVIGEWANAQSWAAIHKLWKKMRKVMSTGNYHDMLKTAMRIQKVAREKGIAVVPFENLGLEIEEGELDATVPHTEEELVVLADEIANKRNSCTYEIEHDEIEEEEDPYSQKNLEAAYEERKSCTYEVREDSKKEKRKSCEYNLK